MELKILSETKGPVVVLKLNGDVTAGTAYQLKDAKQGFVNNDYRLFVLDLSGVNILASIGIREMLGLYKEIEGLGGHLVLCNLKAHVAEILSKMGLFSAFKCYESKEEAVASLV